MSLLFTPWRVRGLTVANRAWVSAMCQYSATDGVVGDWHLAHLGSLATGGFGLVMAEATAVAPEARISVRCPGLWNDEQVTAWRRVTDFAHAQGAHIGVQLAHAGRKASTMAPWDDHPFALASEGGWTAVAPSELAFDGYPPPRALRVEEIDRVVDQFVAAARRARRAGFDVLEIHAAHGYLLHQFLSPISNRRDDGYGGDLSGRMRLLLEVADAVRNVLPQDMPVWARLSMLEAGAPGGYPLEDTLEAARRLHAHGIDLIDCTTGGNAPVTEPEFPGFRLPLSAAVKAAGVPAMPVGHMDYPQLADAAISSGQADLVALARGLLRNPHWALAAQQALHVEPTPPIQYRRAYR